MYPQTRSKNPSLLAALGAMVLAPLCTSAEVTTLEEVKVTAEALSTLEERRNAVTQKTVIDRQAIAATGALTVGEVLSKLPGVEADSPGTDGTTVARARGMVRDSVQILVDGERPASNSRHALMLLMRMPTGELEQVELMKGASAEFGNGAPVTINLVTNRTRRKAIFTYRLNASSRSGEPGVSASLTREDSSGPWSWSLPLSINQNRSPLTRTVQRRESTGGAGTLWQTDGEKGRNIFSEAYFAPKLNWKESRSSFSIWPSLFRAEGDRRTGLDRIQYADPIAGTGPVALLQRDDQERNHYRVARLRLEGETFTRENNKLSARLSVMSGVRDTDILRNGSSGWAIETYQRREDEVNSSLRLDRPWGEHLTSVGLEYITLERKEQQNLSGAVIDNAFFRSKERQFVLWLQDELAIDPKVTLTGGLRGETISLTADAVSRRTGSVSPSLALRWNLSDSWQLRTSIGGGLKAPKLEEISNAPIRSVAVNSPVEPDRRGNPSLTPEKSINLEVGLDHYWPDEIAVVGINTYVRETSDFIERRSALESGRWVERPYNEGDARHWGLELDARLKGGTWGLSGGSLRSHLTLPHGNVEDKRLGLQRAARELPRYLWSFGYDQSLPEFSSSIGLSWQRTGETRTDVPNEQWMRIPARTVLDAYWVKKLDRSSNLRLTLQNILGEDMHRVTRIYSASQDWTLGSNEKQARTLLLTFEGKW